MNKRFALVAAALPWMLAGSGCYRAAQEAVRVQIKSRVEECTETCAGLLARFWGFSVHGKGYRCICVAPKTPAEKDAVRRAVLRLEGWFTPRGQSCPYYLLTEQEECRKKHADCEIHSRTAPLPSCGMEAPAAQSHTDARTSEAE